jgi:hypothetical protein
MSADDARGQKDGQRAGAATSTRRAAANSARLDRVINDRIGRRLQAHYKALAEEPLPDRFMVLLAQLRAKELKP